MKHLFVLNPVAGGTKARPIDTQRKIQTFAQTLEEPYEIYLTRTQMDAAAKVKEDAAQEEKLYVYACGGDGTLNECVNGAANNPNVAITHYPCGTGNDFIKTFGKENIEKFRDLKALSEGDVRALDLIDCDGRYGINICSIGIDARVGGDVHKYSSIPLIGGATGYVVSLVVNTIKGVKEKFHITYNGHTQDEPITLVCACNGRYYGGGFNPIPEAIPDDGIIEFLIVKGVSRLKLANVVGRYAKGLYRELSDISKLFRGTSMEIKGEKEFVINIDGEIIRAKKISFKMVPKGINFLLPKGVSIPVPVI
jgi:YegS/Rv2252/BmrU family lipid kinase